MHITDAPRRMWYSHPEKENPLIFFTTRRGRPSYLARPPYTFGASPGTRSQESQDVVVVEVEDGKGKQEAVDPVERPPVAGQEDPRIFHPRSALQL